MTLHLPTLYAVAGMASLMAGILHLIPWTTRRFGRWAAWWGSGHVAIGIGSLITLLHDAIPVTVSVAVPNLMLVTGYAMVLHAVRLFAAPSSRVAGLAVVMAIVAIPLGLSRDPGAYASRIAYLCVVRALLDLAIAVAAVRIARARRLHNAWLMVALFAATVPLFLMRGWLAANGQVGATLLSGGQAIDTAAAAWLAAAAITIIMFRSFSLLLLDAEQSHRGLVEQACHDNLTGALNRLGLTRLRADLNGRVAVMMIDLDRFKQLNDTQGHAAGDAVLRLAAQSGQRVLAGHGTLVRTGGDEFVGILPGLSLAAAQAAAAELELDFARALAQADGATDRVTLSIGVAVGTVAGGQDEGFERLLQEADAAMYAVKRGRMPSRRRQAA